MPAESDNRKRFSRREAVGVCILVGALFLVFCLLAIWEFEPIVRDHDVRRRVDEGVLSVEQAVENQLKEKLSLCFGMCALDHYDDDGCKRCQRGCSEKKDSIRARLEGIDTSLSSRRYKNEWNTYIVIAPRVGGTFLSLWNRIGNALGPRSFRDERDGRIYKTIKIGKQEWMAQNLDFGTRKSCFDEKPENCGPDGGLYTLDAAREACPDGWRLPTMEEWRALRDYHVYNYAFARGDNVVPWHDLFRRLLKARFYGKGNLICTPLFALILHVVGETKVFGDEPDAVTATFSERTYIWRIPTRADESATAMYRSKSWCPEGKTCDALGFKAVPAGMRSHDGVYRFRGALAGFWASNVSSWAKGPCVFLVDSKTDDANLSCDDHVSYPSSGETYDPQGAYSVRCVKD